MIVQCDKCSQSYRVNAEKLPAQGGRIKCPQCSNIFLVQAKHESLELPMTPMPQPEPEPQPSESTENTWKLRLAGLTYAFQGLDNLHDWMLARTSLDGVKIAKDEDDWRELGDYPGVMTTELITKFFPLGDVPSSSRVEDAPKPITPLVSSDKLMASEIPSTQMSMVTSKKVAKPRTAHNKPKDVSTGVSSGFRAFLIIIVAAVVCVGILYWGGIINLDQFLPKGEGEYSLEVPVPAPKDTAKQAEPTEHAVQNPEPNVQVQAPVAPTLSPDEQRAIELQAYEKQIAVAKGLVAKKQWPEARAVIENLLAQHPEDRQVNELALKVYRALNLNQDAERVRKVISSLKK